MLYSQRKQTLIIDEIIKEQQKMNDIIKQLRQIIDDRQGNLDDESIKTYIIYDFFLENMGYDKRHCDFKTPLLANNAGILVKIDKNHSLAIGIKNSSDELTMQDIAEIKSNVTNLGHEYAILTNGTEYMLLNFKIECASINGRDIAYSNIVFWFDINKSKGSGLTELKYFDYLRCENIYGNETTRFFVDIAQYKVWKMNAGLAETSWAPYQSTLYNYYDYISKKNCKYQNIYKTMTESDFEAFISARKRTGKQTSIKTIANNHSHIYDMLVIMKDNGKISHFNFEEKRNKSLENFDQTKDKKIPYHMGCEEIDSAIETYSGKRNSTRNIIIYLMCATLGMERSQVLNVKWSDFDRDFKHIIIDNRKINLHEMMQRYLEIYREEQGENSEYVFALESNNGNHKQLNESTVNDVFNALGKANQNKEIFSPKFVKRCLIVSMFYEGYSIDDIVYVTGMDMKNLEKDITKDMIVERKKTRDKGIIDWARLYGGRLGK